MNLNKIFWRGVVLVTYAFYIIGFFTSVKFIQIVFLLFLPCRTKHFFGNGNEVCQYGILISLL